MTEDTRMTVARTSALDVYGAGDDIKTLADRIKLCLPGGDKLQRHEALALAQLSIAYQLNPFNGEVWFIPGKGTQVGIKGLRKTGHRQAAYWTEFLLLTQEERAQNGVPDKAIAYKCLLYRTDLIRESAAACKAFRDAGMTDAVDRYAYRPATGIGYWTVGETTKMKGDQAARKRAEADALKQAFDLPFASEVGNGNTIGYVDTEWREVSQATGPEWTELEEAEIVGPETPRAEIPREVPVTAAGKRPLGPEVIRATVRKKSGWVNGSRLDGEAITPKQIPTIAMLLAEACKLATIHEGGELDHDRHAILTYVIGVASTGSLTKREAGAIIDWLTIPGSLELHEYAPAEVQLILTAGLVEAGQQALDLPVEAA